MSPAADRKLDLLAWLKAQISRGKLVPGERIDMLKICSTFGVSRTPVREALLQLQSLGLVDIRPRRGAVVKRISLHELLWMWEVLVGLEGLCAELASRRMSADGCTQLNRIHIASEMHVRTGDVAAYDDANRRFHECIYAGCGNPYLAGQVRDLRERLSQYRRYPFERPHGIKQSFRGHAAVVEAILSGDDRGADTAMREHVMIGGKAFLDLFAEMMSSRGAGTDASERELAAAFRRGATKGRRSELSQASSASATEQRSVILSRAGDTEPNRDG